ncbi:MAG: hypothetical protein EBU93_04795 [Chlamydiae bacterium]|jgi:hypothetical protein|uniref:Uncharacterized protein n=1 Tax=viral metagenome TaxID=1070528 RepID=A0A6C0H2Y0_9ZZZZ|nr:hypothetical protein [Chlamydiota bacterium]
MIDEKDPVKMAYASLTISFVIFIVIIYVFKPGCVQVVDRHTGMIYVSWKLALSYSATFSFIIAIGTLMLISNNLDRKEALGYEMVFIPNFSTM